MPAAMLTFVVMPCLNEAGCVAQAAASLGFGPNADPPEDAELLAVDNGSTDGTAAVLDGLASTSRGRITLLREPTRGLRPAEASGLIRGG